MPLSDNERDVLDQIERDFAAADPVLADALATSTRDGARVLFVDGTGLLAGLGLLLLGLWLPPLAGTMLAVIGYAILVASSYSATIAVRVRRSTPSAGPGSGRSPRLP